MVFDPSSFLDAIEEATKEAVRESLESVADRARYLAPVRRIFKTTQRRRLKTPIGVAQPVLLNETRGPAFRYAERAGVPVGFLHSGRAFASPVFARIQTTGALAADVRRNRNLKRVVELEPKDRLRRRTRVNARQPVIRLEGIGRVTGNFRELSEPGRLAISTVYARVGGRTVRGEVASALTARGRYEVRTGRAVTAAGEVGGTLRDSIESEGPFVQRGEVYGFVKAAAFNESGFNYALAQEIGTAHNRPQPYLRPALRELHDRILNNQRNAIRTYLRRAKGTGRGTEDIPITHKLQVNFRGFTGIEKIIDLEVGEP